MALEADNVRDLTRNPRDVHFFLIALLAAGSFLLVTPPAQSTETVIPAQDSPAGIVKRLDNGVVVGGRPKLPAQTRITDPDHLTVSTVGENLTVPWGMEFGPDGKLYFTERPGAVKILDPASGDVNRLFEPPNTLHWGEGGLMGIELHPEFPDTPVLFLSQTHGSTANPANRIIRVSLAGGEVTTTALLDDIPAASYHNGSRLEIGPDGYLYATTGDAGDPRLAQQLESPAGKILRMTLKGEPAPGNPFSGDGTADYVYSYGHRNPQGLAWHPETNDLFASEHGPSGELGLSGNDEVNRIQKGANYGWPNVVGAPGVEPYRDPYLHFDDPHLPPAGLAFLDDPGSKYHNNLFVGSLYGSLLLQVAGTAEGPPRFIYRLFEEEFYQGQFGRIRAVEMGPDDSIFFSTSNRDGRGNPASNDDRIIKLTPTTTSNPGSDN